MGSIETTWSIPQPAINSEGSVIDTGGAPDAGSLITDVGVASAENTSGPTVQFSSESDDDDESTPRSARPGPAVRGSNRTQKALARKVSAKTLQIEAATSDQRSLLASLLDVDASVDAESTTVEISVAVAAGMNGGDRIAKAYSRKVSKKTIRVNNAESSHRRLLSVLLEVSEEIVDLAVAALATSTSTATADLYRLADADPMEAGMLAAEMLVDKGRMRSLWTLLDALGAVSGAQPKEANKAGIAVGRAAQGITADKRAEIDAALALMG